MKNIFNSIKAWTSKHKKGILITSGVVAIVGTVAILLINGKKATISVEELADNIVPELPKTVEPDELVADGIEKVALPVGQIEDMISVEINGSTKTFPRSEFIRQLHEGWHPSVKKVAQAAEMGIELEPGETIVNACTVSRRVA